jgi:malonyl-CoA/methylmalonyl-CoA synthetase
MIVESWLVHAESSPRQRVLHDDAGGWVSAAELESRTRAAAACAASLGLVRGDRVIVSGSASVDLAVGMVGLFRLGITVLPVNPALSAREVRHVVSDASPVAAFVADGDLARHIDDTGAGLHVAGLHTLARASRQGDPDGLDRVEPDDPALVIYTSGTTGAPKGAVLTHANLAASTAAVRNAWRWDTSDRLVLALPPFHVHGLVVGLLGTLFSGASVTLRGRFTPEDVVESAAAHAATLFFGVPTMYARLTRSGLLGGLGALRLLVSGSAPLSPAQFDAVEAACRQRVLERYGTTETLMISSNPLDGERRPGSVGLPLPSVAIRLDSESGEILVRGPSVFGGYLGSPEASAAAFTDGWFRTGDAGVLDDAGYLRIVGRLKELIITGGFNVYPREVEDVLRSHPGVSDVAVVGLPSDEWGEQVVAFIEGDAPAEALRDLAATGLAHYKCPREFRFVESLPRNPLGKVLKAELAGEQASRPGRS